MTLPRRTSIRVLLINQNNELLLMHVHDPTTTSLDGTRPGCFWCPVGGGPEPGESIEQTALREIFEETGFTQDQVELGPVVWTGSYQFVRCGVPTHADEKYVVAYTRTADFHLENLTEDEKSFVTKAAWFTVDTIRACPEVIFPVVLAEHLQDILDGNYPETPLEIDLGKKPALKSQKT